jgi:putative thioredoxin
MAAYVADVSTADFAASVLERSFEVPVVVDFWADWCGPCKVLGPTLERLADEGGGRWELAKVDVDANQQLAMQFGVQGIPTVVGFKDGEAVARFTGAVPEPAVRQFIDGLLPSDLDLAADRAYTALGEGDAALAEQVWRSVLATEPSHEPAGLGLAGLLIERGEHDEALAVLGRLAPTEAVRRLQAAARLTPEADLAELAAAAEGDGTAAVLAYAKGLAAAGAPEPALERLIDVVGRREDELSESARLVVLDLFELLGPDHPLTTSYRRRLASALF